MKMVTTVNLLLSNPTVCSTGVGRWSLGTFLIMSHIRNVLTTKAKTILQVVNMKSPQ